MSDLDRRKKIAIHALKSRNSPRLNAMLAEAKSERAIADVGDSWNIDPWLLGVGNGVVDLRTNVLRAGRREDKITFATNVDYVPKAKAKRFLQFLEEIFDGDKELIDYVQRIVGYSITGDVSEECFFVLYGNGANGKSKFLGALAKVLGVYLHNLPFSALEIQARNNVPNDIAALVGRRLVTSSEANERSRFNEARIKALTGGDPITARYLYQEFFTFRPFAKFWLATNHCPNVEDDSEGFWRRVRVIPFNVKFDEKTADRHLDQKLAAEAEGILAWAIQGCLAWQEKGLDPVPAAIAAATQVYREESDQLSAFIADRCVVLDGVSVRAGQLYENYVGWAKIQGHDGLDLLSGTMFGRRMTDRFKKINDRQGASYHGIGIRDEHDEPF